MAEHKETTETAEIDLGGAFSSFQQRAERAYFAAALVRAGGNKTRAAREAGLTYDTFCRRVARLGLRVEPAARVIVDA